MRYAALKERAATGDMAAVSELKAIVISNPDDTEALFLLGRIFDEPPLGRIPSDTVSARCYYLRAAMLGHAVAQLCIGNMLDYGEGGGKDLVEARRWYGESAKQGVRDAQMHLGRMLQLGRGGTQDREAAAWWYGQAVKQGDELAATNLAMMHVQGEIRDPDIETALELLRFSADKLDGLAHLHIGMIYCDGKVVPQNIGISLFHLCIAAILLPHGNNRDAALRYKFSVLQHLPKHRDECERAAMLYIKERNGVLLS